MPPPKGTSKGPKQKNSVRRETQDPGIQARQDWRPWGVGGSDIGALLGLSAYRSALDVWLDKVSPEDRTRSVTSLPMRFGSHLEPFVAGEYERLTGHTTRMHEATLRHPEHPELFGHVDRIATLAGNSPQDIVLECKTCSAFRAGEWGDAWSDQVPPDYLAQCLWYLGLTDYEEAHLAVLLGNTDLRVYRIKRDREVERHMFGLAHRFWVEHVLTKQPPPAKTRAQALSLYPKPTAGLSLQAQEEALEAVRRKSRLEAEATAIHTDIEQLKDLIATHMGPAERLMHGLQTLATWRLCKGATRVDLQRLWRERPEIAEIYSVPGTATRRLQINANAFKHLGQP